MRCQFGPEHQAPAVTVADVPEELQTLQRSPHLPTCVLQPRRAHVRSGGVGEPAPLLPQQLQALVRQLQQTQQVQLAALVQAARAQLQSIRTG